MLILEIKFARSGMENEMKLLMFNTVCNFCSHPAQKSFIKADDSKDFNTSVHFELNGDCTGNEINLIANESLTVAVHFVA